MPISLWQRRSWEHSMWPMFSPLRRRHMRAEFAVGFRALVSPSQLAFSPSPHTLNRVWFERSLPPVKVIVDNETPVMNFLLWKRYRRKRNYRNKKQEGLSRRHYTRKPWPVDKEEKFLISWPTLRCCSWWMWASVEHWRNRFWSQYFLVKNCCPCMLFCWSSSLSARYSCVSNVFWRRVNLTKGHMTLAAVTSDYLSRIFVSSFYIGRHRPKGLPFSGVKYMKG